MKPTKRETLYRTARDYIEKANAIIEKVRDSDELPDSEWDMCNDIANLLDDVLMTLNVEADSSEETE